MDEQNTANQQEQNAGTGGNGAQQNDGNTGIDYGKIQAIIDKGTQQKESAILKSYFEQQGMDEASVKAAIGDWKAKKQEQAQKQTDTLAQLQASQKALQDALYAERINGSAYAAALDLGVERNVIPYVIKMADFQDAIDEKGNAKADVVRATIEKVLKDVPGFRASANEAKGFQVGIGSEQQESKDAENALRRAFGLSAKK